MPTIRFLSRAVSARTLALALGACMIVSPLCARADDPATADKPAEKKTEQPASSAKPSKPMVEIKDTSASDPLSRMAIDPDSAEGKAIAKFNRERRELEKKLLQIRYKYFRAQVAKVRREGIEKLADFNQPDQYATLINTFEGQGDDVEDALLDMFAANASDRGDAAIAWCAIFGKRDGLREMATQKLGKRLSVQAKVPARVMQVLIGGLRSGNDAEVINAANLAGALSIFDAIPFLIPAQVGQSAATPDRQGDLAWIAIGKQYAYVADLNPIVSDNAVAFDPVPGVVTEGALLRIQDAVVTTVYRGDVQIVLKRLGGDYTGQPVPELGFNMKKWWDWYREEVVPQRAAREKLEREAAAKEAAGRKK
ncbi:MAG: hypothetical protein KGS45_08220 [Planctomycetes bacterium]|nr:hypothetical protein [Planctomycetota bacterium]